MEIPEKYDPGEAERRWRERWDETQIYAWDPSRPRAETFVVDTPPPTVSGELHIGHVFSYTQQDLIVRYQRMLGRNIAYPMGWDDNGLPTERRVQNVFRIRPSRDLPYDPAWQPSADKGAKDPVEEVSRLNFIEACERVCEADEQAFEALWRQAGLSVDWTLGYRTIDAHCRRTAQFSFLDLHERGQVYQTLSPAMWDADFATAIAQAEVEDREKPGAYHDIRFAVDGGGELLISTTRPELLGACIAVVAHPDDERYQKLFGKTAVTPLFHAPVPILPAAHADPEKGTGILMVCTFGDSMDVEWWRSSGLPLRQLIGPTGRLVPAAWGEAPFETRDAEAAARAHAELEGRTVKQAQRRIVELLGEEGSLVGEPRAITHPVKFYERGERPLEFVPTRQWFVKLLEHKAALLEQGRKITWHPAHMRNRYDNWVEGLNQDWCISRQRFAGVPFPVWYPIDDAGAPDYERPLLAERERLPVDPLAEPPPGYRPEQRNQPGGFAADPDVMDTWATSSLTPQITSHWASDAERHQRLFPADLRPQSHEIIRTWAFYTIVKAWMHEGKVPWHHITISGWILDPDRKKMSKSKGKVMTGSELLAEHSTDAIRYWSSRARLGVDTALDPTVFKQGRRLVTKLFNASRFVLGQLENAGADLAAAAIDEIQAPLDLAYVARLRGLVEHAGAAFEQFDYAGALQATEEHFWEFCDDYLELVKARSYAEQDGAGRQSALATLLLALRTFLRLFAPFLPFVTEEVWSWRFGDGGARSIHLEAWPSLAESDRVPAPAELESFDCAMEVLRKIRQTKTQAKRSLRWPVERLEVRGEAGAVAALEPALRDVLSAGNADPASCSVAQGVAPEGERFSVMAALAEENA